MDGNHATQANRPQGSERMAGTLGSNGFVFNKYRFALRDPEVSERVIWCERGAGELVDVRDRVTGRLLTLSIARLLRTRHDLVVEGRTYRILDVR